MSNGSPSGNVQWNVVVEPYNESTPFVVVVSSRVLLQSSLKRHVFGHVNYVALVLSKKIQGTRGKLRGEQPLSLRRCIQKGDASNMEFQLDRVLVS